MSSFLSLSSPPPDGHRPRWPSRPQGEHNPPHPPASSLFKSSIHLLFHILHPSPYITGFRFMANKQFRMEKRLGTSVCADISKYALKNQYIQFLYEKNHSLHFFGWRYCFFCRFLNQIRLRKTVFWTNMEWNVIFNPILKYFTIYKNFFGQHVCFVI